MTLPSSITTTEIMRVVPHRHPFLLIDRVVELEPGKRVRGFKNVSAGEALVGDTLVGPCVFPRLLVIEAVGQAALVLVTYGLELDAASVPLFVGCDYEFHSDVESGSRLELEAEIVKVISTGAIITGKASVESRLIAEMRLTATFQRVAEGPASSSRRQSGS
jgi:3-hydroxymyristoyl/3-hydroxydecanoyl-(acyl carrier protein) dehydratase